MPKINRCRHGPQKAAFQNSYVTQTSTAPEIPPLERSTKNQSIANLLNPAPEPRVSHPTTSTPKPAPANTMAGAGSVDKDNKNRGGLTKQEGRAPPAYNIFSQFPGPSFHQKLGSATRLTAPDPNDNEEAAYLKAVYNSVLHRLSQAKAAFERFRPDPRTGQESNLETVSKMLHKSQSIEHDSETWKCLARKMINDANNVSVDWEAMLKKVESASEAIVFAWSEAAQRSCSGQQQYYLFERTPLAPSALADPKAGEGNELLDWRGREPSYYDLVAAVNNLLRLLPELTGGFHGLNFSSAESLKADKLDLDKMNEIHESLSRQKTQLGKDVARLPSRGMAGAANFEPTLQTLDHALRELNSAAEDAKQRAEKQEQSSRWVDGSATAGAPAISAYGIARANAPMSDLRRTGKLPTNAPVDAMDDDDDDDFDDYDDDDEYTDLDDDEESLESEDIFEDVGVQQSFDGAYPHQRRRQGKQTYRSLLPAPGTGAGPTTQAGSTQGATTYVQDPSLWFSQTDVQMQRILEQSIETAQRAKATAQTGTKKVAPRKGAPAPPPHGGSSKRKA